MNAAARNQRA
jgi:hypothetical protein